MITLNAVTAGQSDGRKQELCRQPRTSEFGFTFQIRRRVLNRGTLMCKHYSFHVPSETKGEQAPQLILGPDIFYQLLANTLFTLRAGHLTPLINPIWALVIYGPVRLQQSPWPRCLKGCNWFFQKFLAQTFFASYWPTRYLH